MEKQKEYNLRYLLAKVRSTRRKASDRLRQRANKRNKNRVGRLPTGKSYCRTRSDVGLKRVKLPSILFLNPSKGCRSEAYLEIIGL
jgi:late competence protein required for DNA uptake (superfamily II DNA/RNA helicase)